MSGGAVTSLGAVGVTFGGLTGKTKRDFGHGDGRFVTFVEVMSDARLRGRALESVDTAERERQNEVRRGDVLFNGSSETPEEVALAAVVDFEVPRRVYLNSFCFGYRITRPEAIDPTFLAYYFRSGVGRRLVSALAQGATRYNISKTKLMELPLSLPGFAEQRAVAEALCDCDDLIASFELLIGKKQDVKQGVMQELLTGRARLAGFEDEWKRVSLSQLGTFLRGRGIKRDDVRASGVPCIRYGELYTTYENYTASPVSFVDSLTAATALPIRKGDVLFAGSGETKEEIGMSVAYVGESPAVAGGDIIALRGSGFDPVFLASLLNTPQVVSQKASGAQGDAVVHINWRVLAAISLAIPSRAEQEAIARALLDADAEIAALRDRLESARAVKTGMMQELLTGRTRLPVEAAS